ncbi:MAG: ISNCY family transposase, partial [Gemmatimonadales bacterium]
MVTLSMGELDRLQVLTQVAERRLTRRRAAELLALTERQVRRLCARFAAAGAAGLASRHRSRTSNRRLPLTTREQALALVREHYRDFGPTFAHQKLTEEHALTLSVETLRGWMTAADIWVPRTQRTRRSYPPRPRRACLGELVQLDGSPHAWFEDRGPVCTLLVYIDDATSRLMELCCADVESTFDYFHATRRYLERHGKPMAFYSDKLSVFHVAARDQAAGGPGVSQFGRALRDLNIDIICANSPEAKGRVERANLTLQDRLVKELRLRGLNHPTSATPYLPAFMADHNARFAQPPRVAYDAHRPLRPEEDLDQIFTWQETRHVSRQLTVNYKRDLYVLEDSVENRRLRGHTVLLSEDAANTVTLRAQGRLLAARLFPKDHARVAPGTIVEHKHLDGVFQWIAAQQAERDAARLASPKLTRREKKHLRPTTPPAPGPRGPATGGVTIAGAPPWGRRGGRWSERGGKNPHGCVGRGSCLGVSSWRQRALCASPATTWGSGHSAGGRRQLATRVVLHPPAPGAAAEDVGFRALCHLTALTSNRKPPDRKTPDHAQPTGAILPGP